MNASQLKDKAGELQAGGGYLCFHPLNGSPRQVLRVTFVEYTACPAVVIVRDDLGRVFRCSRRAIFEYPGNADQDLHAGD